MNFVGRVSQSVALAPGETEDKAPTLSQSQLFIYTVEIITAPGLGRNWKSPLRSSKEPDAWKTGYFYYSHCVNKTRW